MQLAMVPRSRRTDGKNAQRDPPACGGAPPARRAHRPRNMGGRSGATVLATGGHATGRAGVPVASVAFVGTGFAVSVSAEHSSWATPGR